MSEEIDFDVEYFQRKVLREADRLASRDVKQRFSGDQDIEDQTVDGYYESQRELHYHEIMKNAALAAEIPIHVETNKTATSKAVRYRAGDGAKIETEKETGDINLIGFERIEVTVSETRDMEKEGWYRSPSEALAFAKGKESNSITAEQLAEMMNAKDISATELADAIGKKQSTVVKYLASGVPQTMTEQVQAAL